MSTFNGVLNLVSPDVKAWHGRKAGHADRDGRPGYTFPPETHDPEVLRHIAWSIGERHPADTYVPDANHAGLAMVTPHEGFAHWHVRPEWVEQTARARGDAWHHCRLVLRLYDVSFIEFNGFNAHRIQDEPLDGLFGQRFFKLPRTGTWQLAEVGFLLRSGEFIPAARSPVVPFAPEAGSSRGSQEALLVTDRGEVEPVGNLWDQERILQERRRPRLRQPLRIASLAMGSLISGQEGPLAAFVTELAAGQVTQGHEVHVFVPASESLRDARPVDGVHYHPVELPPGSPVQQGIAFARAVEKRLADLPPFDLVHLHEWMAGLVDWPHTRPPTVLSLSSVEATRRNGAPVGELSLEVEEAERFVAQKADCLLVPEWLRDKAATELGVDAGRVRPFPMEGRLANEWECPLDYGQVKKEIGLGPLDRVILFVGPLDHAAGVDLLVEALPVLLQRCGNLRLVFVGEGPQHGHLGHRAGQMGVGWAVRLLGHVEGQALIRLLRAAEALALPSRYRVPFDDAVVDLARRAGRPVITTHSGPAHLVRHEENGVITYDNPGSMVWALDRILGDPAHAERMGRNGRRCPEGSAPRWSEVARLYLELCAVAFPELSETVL